MNNDLLIASLPGVTLHLRNCVGDYQIILVDLQLTPTFGVMVYGDGNPLLSLYRHLRQSGASRLVARNLVSQAAQYV